MKYLLLPIIIINIVFYSHAQIGRLATLRVATYTIESQPGLDKNPCSHENGDRFYQMLSQYTTQYYPGSYVFRDIYRQQSAVTRAALMSGESQNCDFVYFNNHGNVNLISTWDDWYVYLNDLLFTGNTKWVYINACNVLLSPGLYLPALFRNGIHAVFGYKSDSKWLENKYRCGFLWTTWCYDCRDRYMYDTYFNEWVVNGKTNWDAYSKAAYRQYQETGYAHEIAAYGSDVTVNGVRIYGIDEKYLQVYSGKMNASWSIGRSTIQPGGGTPIY
jgi:hypothetical protein